MEDRKMILFPVAMGDEAIAIISSYVMGNFVYKNWNLYSRAQHIKLSLIHGAKNTYHPWQLIATLFYVRFQFRICTPLTNSPRTNRFVFNDYTNRVGGPNLARCVDAIYDINTKLMHSVLYAILDVLKKYILWWMVALFIKGQVYSGVRLTSGILADMAALNQFIAVTCQPLDWSFVVKQRSIDMDNIVLFHTQRKKLPNLGSNSWVSLPGSYHLTISLMVRWYEPGRENHEFDPRLGNLFLWVWNKKWRLPSVDLLIVLFPCVVWLRNYGIIQYRSKVLGHP